MVVVPDEVDAVDPLDPEVPEEAVPDDRLLERRGAKLVRVVDGATGVLTTAAWFCSSAEIESIGMVGAMESALSTGELSALEQAIVPPSTSAATNMNFFILSTLIWGLLTPI
jgi:hypothetical protein